MNLLPWFLDVWTLSEIFTRLDFLYWW